MVVVSVEEGGEGRAAGVVAGVRGGVGPLAGESAVVALGFAVGLGPVGAGAFVAGAGGEQGIAERDRHIAGAVVGHAPFDLGDAVVGVEGCRPVPEGGSGCCGLVRQFLAVGQPGVVVDCGVDVAVADPLGAGGLVRGAASTVDAPATAIGDTSDLLDV